MKIELSYEVPSKGYGLPALLPFLVGLIMRDVRNAFSAYQDEIEVCDYEEIKIKLWLGISGLKALDMEGVLTLKDGKLRLQMKPVTSLSKAELKAAEKKLDKLIRANVDDAWRFWKSAS